jgi:hypothetical protein
MPSIPFDHLATTLRAQKGGVMPTIPFDRLSKPYAYLDPASGRKTSKRPGARSALIVACSAPPAYTLVLYSWAARASTTEITNQIFSVHEQFHPIQMAIETAGQQYLLFSHIQDEARRRNIRLPLIEGTQYTEDAKDQRIKECLEPLTTQGRLCILSHQQALRDELADYPFSATKDCLDALAGCVNLIPKPHVPHDIISTKQAILDYLHRSHAVNPEHIINTLYPTMH